MTRKNENRLLPSKTHRYGSKAMAAIVAGAMALSLVPMTAFAEAPQMGQAAIAQPGMRKQDMEQPGAGQPFLDLQMQGNEDRFVQQNSQPMQEFDQQPQSDGQPFEMPEGQDGQQNENAELPPAAPEAENDAQQGGLPPAMPEGQDSPQGESGGQQGERPPAVPGEDNGQQGENGGQQGERPSAIPGAPVSEQMPEDRNRQHGNLGDMLKDFIQKFAEMGGIRVDVNGIDEFMKSVFPQQAPTQDQQVGQPSQQPGQLGEQNAQPGQPGEQNGQMSNQNGQQNAQQPGQPSGQNGQQPGLPGGQNAQQNGQQPGQSSQSGQSGQQPGQSGQPGQLGQPGGANNAPTSYDAAYNLTENGSQAEYSSTSGNQNAVLVDGKTISLDSVTVSKTGDANGEDADFYGINAAILANNGSTLTIANSDVTTDGAHANGVFSYGFGTTINISDSTINTTGNNSGGLMTTGGASLNATNLSVTTSGNSSAAIRTDRGGGTVTATQGSYATSGVGSPAIYSTADITVSDATLSASNSEAIVIEGGNSVTLNNANVTGSNTTLNGQSTQKTNVLIYQSMSGDASEGDSSFNMTSGTLTSLTGSMFHVTNTTTTINLDGVTLVGASDSSDFLVASADSWGTSGSNGGNATVNLTNQTVEGNIVVDDVSSVTLNIKSGSSYTGLISSKGTTNVSMEEGSAWTLTGDSYITSLSGNTSGINLNGYKLYVNGAEYAG